MEFIVRKMQIEDIPQVQHIAKTSWNDTYKGIIPLEIQDSFLKSAYTDEMMKKRFEGSLLFVAVVNEKIIGFENFSLLKNDGESELIAIYLYPSYQGMGIGTALVNEGIKNLEGVKRIFVNVEKENKIGITFYKSKGFEAISEYDDDFDGHVLKTVRMVLSL